MSGLAHPRDDEGLAYSHDDIAGLVSDLPDDTPLSPDQRFPSCCYQVADGIRLPDVGIRGAITLANILLVRAAGLKDLHPRQSLKAIDPLYVLGSVLKIDFGSDAMSHLAVVSMRNQDKYPARARPCAKSWAASGWLARMRG